MKITVLTLGSRGDVQPYVALGKELLSRGHHVSLCTGRSFKDFIESNGLDYKPASMDFMELLKFPEGKAIMNGGGNIFRTMKFAKEVIYPLFRQTFDEFFQACQGCDLIIYHPKAMVATDIAEYMGIPCLSLPPVPLTFPVKEMPNLALTSRKTLGPLLNKLSYLASKYGESGNMKDINDFRQKTLHLKKRKAGAYSDHINGKLIPIIYPNSPSLFEDVLSWKGRVELTGFFYMDLDNARLDEEVLNFIEKGRKPIIISFSSMPLKDPQAFKSILIKALEKSGDRALLLTGVNSIDFTGYDHILAVEKAPHRLLFKLGKGIIHHGGVGTLSEALLSGVPQVIMPFNVDQPFWAKRLYRLGYALEPLREKTLTTSTLVERFNQFDLQTNIDRAKAIALKVKNENGVANAANYIEKILSELTD